jgi:hypothetical protein
MAFNGSSHGAFSVPVDTSSANTKNTNTMANQNLTTVSANEWKANFKNVELNYTHTLLKELMQNVL